MSHFKNDGRRGTFEEDLQENVSKEQVFHRNKGMRHELVRQGLPANSVNKETTILGFTMMPAQRRKATKKDAGRVQEATYRAKRCAVLPGGHSRRTRLARMAVPTKAAWGMLCRQPTKREQTSFFLLAKQVNKCTFGRNKLARTCCGSCLGILGI